MRQHRFTTGLFLAMVTLLAGCSSTPGSPVANAPSREVCDSYLMMDMCVRDLSGDASVDMVYFTESREVFMYQQGRRELVREVMPLHRCAVALNPGMQETTNRILHRKTMSFTEELDITRKLIANYVAAKPAIDACNARYEQAEKKVAWEIGEEEFDWGEE